MYFFLSNLSFVDICFTSTTVPKMLDSSVSPHHPSSSLALLLLLDLAHNPSRLLLLRHRPPATT
ncbi:hypothetical protein A6R68_13498, partial [Neotoma lepida]